MLKKVSTQEVKYLENKLDITIKGNLKHAIFSIIGLPYYSFGLFFRFYIF